MWHYPSFFSEGSEDFSLGLLSFFFLSAFPAFQGNIYLLLAVCTKSAFFKCLGFSLYTVKVKKVLSLPSGIYGRGGNLAPYYHLQKLSFPLGKADLPA